MTGSCRTSVPARGCHRLPVRSLFVRARSFRKTGVRASLSAHRRTTWGVRRYSWRALAIRHQTFLCRGSPRRRHGGFDGASHPGTNPGFAAQSSRSDRSGHPGGFCFRAVVPRRGSAPQKRGRGHLSTPPALPAVVRCPAAVRRRLSASRTRQSSTTRRRCRCPCRRSHARRSRSCRPRRACSGSSSAGCRRGPWRRGRR